MHMISPLHPVYVKLQKDAKRFQGYYSFEASKRLEDFANGASIYNGILARSQLKDAKIQVDKNIHNGNI